VSADGRYPVTYEQLPSHVTLNVLLALENTTLLPPLPLLSAAPTARKPGLQSTETWRPFMILPVSSTLSDGYGPQKTGCTPTLFPSGAPISDSILDQPPNHQHLCSLPTEIDREIRVPTTAASSPRLTNDTRHCVG